MGRTGMRRFDIGAKWPAPLFIQCDDDCFNCFTWSPDDSLFLVGQLQTCVLTVMWYFTRGFDFYSESFGWHTHAKTILSKLPCWRLFWNGGLKPYNPRFYWLHFNGVMLQSCINLLRIFRFVYFSDFMLHDVW